MNTMKKPCRNPSLIGLLPLLILGTANATESTPKTPTNTATPLVVEVHSTQHKSPKISGYDKPAEWIAQSTAQIKGKNAAKTGSDRLEDFADYTPGVQSANGTGSGSAVMVRGFRAYQGNIDGLPDVQGFYLRDPATLESVDIAKGRDSTLFGFGSPGGTVNYVSKKPAFTPQRIVSLQTGTPTLLRGLLDVTGPLANKDWAGRLLIAGQQADTGYANVGDDRFSILPSLRWRDNNQTLLLSLEHGWQNREANDTTIFLNGAPVYNRSYVDPRSIADRRMTRVGIDYTRQLNDNWAASLQASHIKAQRKETHNGIGLPTDSPDIWDNYYRKMTMDQTQTALRTELSHARGVGKLRQQTRIGFFMQDVKSAFQSGALLGVSTLNVQQPTFDSPLPDDSQLTLSGMNTTWPERAWYLQHQTTLNDKLGISLGLRNSHTKIDAEISGFTAQPLDEHDTSTSLGLVWQMTPQWQWFASHSESFDPNTGWDRNRHLFEPEQSVQHETGIRYVKEIPDRQPLKASLSTYRIDRKNVATADPLDPSYSVLTGSIQADGVEVSLEKPLMPKLNLTAGYSYSDAKVTSSNSGRLGNHLSNVPRHSGSLILAYTPKPNTELSLGAVRVGKRPGDNDNRFDVPAYTRLDAAAQWQVRKNLTLTAGVRNLLDKDYVASSSDVTSLVQGRKRSVTLGLEVGF